MDSFEEVSRGDMNCVLHVEQDQLVSCDFQGNSHSAVIDAKASIELNAKVIHISPRML